MILPERRSTFVPYTTAFRAVLLNRLIVLQCGAQLMLAKGNMCKGVGRLWRFSFNDTATTEIYTLSLHDALPIYLSECQTNFRNHPPADLDVLLNRLIVLQCGAQLMLAKGNMRKGVGRLWRLAIQKQRRTGWISLNGKGRD